VRRIPLQISALKGLLHPGVFNISRPFLFKVPQQALKGEKNGEKESLKVNPATCPPKKFSTAPRAHHFLLKA